MDHEDKQEKDNRSVAQTLCNLCHSRFVDLCVLLLSLSVIGILTSVVLSVNDVIPQHVEVCVIFSCCVICVISISILIILFVYERKKEHDLTFHPWSWISNLVICMESWLILSGIVFSLLALVSETTMNKHRNDFVTEKGSKSSYHPIFITATACNAIIALIFFLLLVIVQYIICQNNKDKANLSEEACGGILWHSTKQASKEICKTLIPKYLVCCQFGEFDDSVKSKKPRDMLESPKEAALSDALLDYKNRADLKKETVDTEEKHLIDKLDEIRAILEQGIQVKTGWIVLTWQLFAIELYLLASEEIGGEMLLFTKETQCYLYITAVIVHIVIILVAIAVSTGVVCYVVCCVVC